MCGCVDVRMCGCAGSWMCETKLTQSQLPILKFSNPQILKSSNLIQRERRGVVDEQQEVRLDANQPAQRTDAEVVEGLRVLAGDQDDQPGDERRDPPRAQHEEQR